MKKICAFAVLSLTLIGAGRAWDVPFLGHKPSPAPAATPASDSIAGNPAPNFAWEGISKANSLRAVRGQPVVLLIAKDARVKAFQMQVQNLRELYEKFASEKVIFVAAIEEGIENVRSDIPFALASDPKKIADDFGCTGNFGIVIIGKDGNIDYATPLVLPATRVQDVIANSFVEQNDRRKP